MVFVVSFCCFCFPLLLCFAAFSHDLDGEDPCSYVAYPRVVVPAPRPSEGPGALLAPVLTFLGIFSLLCVWQRVGPFYLGRGRFLCPLRLFSHALVFCFLPQVFFFSFLLFLSLAGLRMGCISILYSTNGMTHSERCSERTPEHSATPPSPRLSLDFFMV